MVTNHKFFLYGKPGCPYCEKAKLLLDSMSLNYEYEEVSSSNDRDKLKALYKHSTFPMIFYDNAFIGGFTELRRHLEKEMQEMQHLLFWSDF